MTYAETLADLFRRNRRGIKPGLDATRDLAAALAIDLNAVPMVLVAGTNGKGSVSSLIAHLCSKAGFKTGHYSSPHLLRFSERMRVDGVEISPEEVIQLWQRIVEIEDTLEHPPSFFEICTVMAHSHFQEQNCDFVVFEVGLGGRLDATNAASPILSVITNIGLDHQHILGDTIAEIAAEKAGIARPGRPCIIGPQTYVEAREKLEADANSRGALTTLLPSSVSKSTTPQFISDNIATATAAYKALRALNIQNRSLPAFSPKNIESWSWPGRFELLTSSTQPPILIDGAHNAQALSALVEGIQRNPETAYRSYHILYSCVDTRDPSDLLGYLDPLNATISLCPSSVDRSLSALQLSEVVGNYPVFPSVEDGIKALVAQATNDDLIIVTGSLFAVADAKAYLQGLTRDPPIMG